jgi:hypothetical protein
MRGRRPGPPSSDHVSDRPIVERSWRIPEPVLGFNPARQEFQQRRLGGGADDKSSCAIAMLALREISRSAALSGDLVAAFTIDEEGSSIGTSHLVAHHRADGQSCSSPWVSDALSSSTRASVGWTS